MKIKIETFWNVEKEKKIYKFHIRLSVAAQCSRLPDVRILNISLNIAYCLKVRNWFEDITNEHNVENSVWNRWAVCALILWINYFVSLNILFRTLYEIISKIQFQIISTRFVWFAVRSTSESIRSYKCASATIGGYNKNTDFNVTPYRDPGLYIY